MRQHVADSRGGADQPRRSDLSPPAVGDAVTRYADDRPPSASLPRDRRGWNVTPAPDGRGMPQTNQPPPHRTRGFLYFVLALFAINILLSVVFDQTSSQPRVTVPFSPVFLREVTSGKVSSITTTGDSVDGTFKKKVVYPANSNATPTTLFATQVPAFWNGSQFEALLTADHVEINAKSTTQTTSPLADILLSFGPTLLFIGLLVFFFRRTAKSGGGLGGLGQFGRSRARRVDPQSIRVTFADVAGIDEAKAELTEIVDFLKNPERYGRLGGRMPHGVLLSGAPGTGKTLLARAVAGEAHA